MLRSFSRVVPTPRTSPLWILLLVVTTVGTVSAGPPPKVLVIGIDGLRSDALEAADTPNIDALIDSGAYSPAAQCEDLTFSGPNWSSILHGVHRDKHNVTTNGYGGSNLAQYPDFFAYLEAHQASWNTARLTTWDAIFIHQPTGADIDLFHDYTDDGDAVVTSWGEQLLSGTHPGYPGLDIDALFVYLADVDVAGHGFGFHKAVPQYIAEIEQNDGQVGVLLAAIQNRPNYAGEDWVVILTSDHGGSIDGGHSGNTRERRTIPFLVSGPSVAVGTPFPAARNVDVSKTVLAHMGAAIPASLDGHVVGLTPTAPPSVAFDVNLVANGGAEYDRGFADFLPDQAIAGWDDLGPDQFTVIAWDSPGGFPASGDPGPTNRGANFFSAGSTGENYASQAIDLTALAGDIDAGAARYELSAWLGGYAGQNDRAQLSAYFRDGAGALLGTDTIGPVTAAERGNQTGLLYRESTGFGVPAGTRSVTIQLRGLYSAGGGTDGYADEISFVVRPGSAPPAPQPAGPAPTAGTTEWRFTGDSGARVDAAFGPGTLEYGDGDGGATDDADEFGVTDGVAVPHIAGEPTSYLHFKQRTAANQGYQLRFGVDSPGDQGVQQFTMILDLYIDPANADNYLGIWNGSSNNSDDCELFLRPISEGYWTGEGGTQGGLWRKGQWNRLVFLNDYSGAGTVTMFVNGDPMPDITAAVTDYMHDGDPNPVWFLSDNTPSETSEGYLAGFAIVDRLLDAAEVARLGAPDAGGIFHPSLIDCQGIDAIDVLSVLSDGVDVEVDRRAVVDSDFPIEFRIVKPTGGGPGKFVAHLNSGAPSVATVASLPAQLGRSCFDFLIPPFGSAAPVAVFSNMNKDAQIGSSNFFGDAIVDPLRAPTSFYSRADVDVTRMPIGTEWTLQAVIINPDASSPRRASVSNAVLIEVR